MPAAHRMPMTFAVETLRSRKRPSGMSGDGHPRLDPEEHARAARRRRRAGRASASTSSRPGCRSRSRTPRSISAAVTVTAPATSSRAAPAVPRPDGSSTRQNANTATPTGRFTMKIQCQSSRSVRTPPSSTPTVPPPAATKPNTPIAFARSPGSVNIVMISESDTAETIAPPRPCTARAPISTCWEFARPQASDAAVKSAIPIRNSRRCPNRSPSRPPSSRKPPKVSR